ncbi:MAG TPA: arsinothricin resistance N-acetyltransferase ArsN1 family A [Candidatus Dormibacteraeota bacterium]
MTTTPKARLATLGDAPAIAQIYNQGIEDRTATFETEPRNAGAVEQLLATRASRYPAVVVEDGNRVLGFAWTSEYRPRAAYAGVAEFAVYVARDSRGRGVGRRAMEALIMEAERRGFWKLVSRIFVENLASRRLCAALGFREVGVYRRHGQLDGKWMDCVIVERQLGAAARD